MERGVACNLLSFNGDLLSSKDLKLWNYTVVRPFGVSG